MSNAIGWEKAVLGTAIYSPELIEQAEFLLPSDFTGCHSEIWANVLNLWRRNAMELRTLVEELRQSGALESISSFDTPVYGEAYITELVGCRGRAMGEFAHNVLDASGKRMLRREAALIEADARDENISYEQALDNAEKRFIAARRRTAVTEGASLADLFGVFIPRMEGMRDGSIDPIWASEILALRNVFHYAEDDDYIIAAARPGLGKSSWIRYEALTAAKPPKSIPSTIINMENSDMEYPRATLAMHLGINSELLRQPKKLNENQVRRIIGAVEELAQLPLYIVSMGGPTVHEIDRVTRRYISEKNIRMLWVDYVQLISNGIENKNADITVSSVHLRGMAKKYKMPTIVAAQLNREIEHRNKYDPQLSDLRDSGSLEQDATTVLFPCPVWKNPTIEQLARFADNRAPDGRPLAKPVAMPIHFKVAKNRNGATGNTKEILWNMSTGTYKTLSENWRQENA